MFRTNCEDNKVAEQQISAVSNNKAHNIDIFFYMTILYFTKIFFNISETLPLTLTNLYGGEHVLSIIIDNS